jgi:hypothetical protein
MMQTYLDSVKQQFTYYKSLGDRTFAQIKDEDLFWQYHAETNSIAILVNHLWGNMMSRWTNFLAEDGEKSWRKRDQEFEEVITSREEMLRKWEQGWACLFEALESIHAENFGKQVNIRNQAHSIPEAINRQLAHYAAHVGQIVFIGKMRAGADWQSLTIPKGKSDAFNREKFSK